MPRNWTIIRAAVEQEILFPSQKALDDYIAKLEADNFPHQLIHSTVQEDGTVVALMRKRYNPINPFFPVESGHWIFDHQDFTDGGYVDIYRCSHCGGKSDKRSKFCPECGFPMEKEADESTKECLFCKNSLSTDTLEGPALICFRCEGHEGEKMIVSDTCKNYKEN